MKKSIYMLFTFILSLFIFSGVVEANSDNMAMWLDCDYKVYSDDINKIETGRPLVFIGGWKSNNEYDGHYRLLNPITFEEHSAALNTWYDSDNPRFDGCWFYSEEDIGKSCNDDSVKKYTKAEALQMLRNGICPAVIRDANDITSNEAIVFAGQGTLKAEPSRLTNQYRFAKDDNTVYAFGYDINGFFIQTSNGKIVKSYDVVYSHGTINKITGTSSSAVEKYQNKFMNVAEFDYNAATILNSAGVVFDSNNNINNLYNAVDNWYTKYGSTLGGKSDEMNRIKSNYSQIINSCGILNDSYDNNKSYSLNGSYTANDMINDLSKLYDELNLFYSNYSNEKVNNYEMCVSNSTTTNAVFSAYNCSMLELLGSIDYVPEQLQQFVLTDINKYLTEVKKLYLDDTSDNEGILNTVLKCSLYMKMNYDDFDLDYAVVSDIADKYAILAESRGITFVYDCESLLGSDLIKKINSYLDIIKIAVPIILIAFGVIDFTKAVFAGEDDMKKAQKSFLKRIFIALLIFLTPTIVNLILELANMVWKNISPNSCGLF